MCITHVCSCFFALILKKSWNFEAVAWLTVMLDFMFNTTIIYFVVSIVAVCLLSLVVLCLNAAVCLRRLVLGVGMVTSRPLQCCWTRAHVRQMWQMTVDLRHCTLLHSMAEYTLSSCYLLTRKSMWSVDCISAPIFSLFLRYACV